MRLVELTRLTRKTRLEEEKHPASLRRRDPDRVIGLPWSNKGGVREVYTKVRIDASIFSEISRHSHCFWNLIVLPGLQVVQPWLYSVSVYLSVYLSWHFKLHGIAMKTTSKMKTKERWPQKGNHVT